MDFTGERLIPGDSEHQELFYEHIARYLFACQFVEGKKVLEIGCGAGYGSALLVSSGAFSVLALDNSAEAIKYAQQNYSRENIEYRICEFPEKYADDSNDLFDVIVSLEVLEHVKKQEEFLKRASKLLSPDGLLIISTPNAENKSTDKQPNPYHVKELNRTQLKDLLLLFFPNIKILGQRRVSGITIYSETEKKKIFESKSIEGESRNYADYLIALCGKVVHAEPVIFEIPFFQDIHRLQKHLETLNRKTDKQNLTIRQLQKENEKKNLWTEKLTHQVKTLEEAATDKDIEIVNLQRNLNDIEKNFGYRACTLLAPFIRLFKNIFLGVGGGILEIFRLTIHLPRLFLLILLLLPRIFLVVISFPPSLVLFIALSLFKPKKKSQKKLLKTQKSNFGISIIIPTWNGTDLLKDCLQSLKESVKNQKVPFEIIVVDAGSNDGTKELVCNHYPDVRLIQLDQNLGFAMNANFGAKAAKYEILYMLNNDMVVQPDFLKSLAPCFEDPNVFAVASNILMLDATEDLETGLTRATIKDGHVVLTHRKTESQTPQTAFYAGGGASAFRKDIFLHFGGFDPFYRPFYAEDLDLSWKARRAGYTILWQPKSQVEHRHRGTIARLVSTKKANEILRKNIYLATLRNVTGNEFIFRTTVGALAAILKGKMQPWIHFWALTKLPGLIARRISDISGSENDENIFNFRSAALDADPKRKIRKDKKFRILVLSPYSPFPPTHGGAIRMFEIWKRVAQKHRVHFLSLVESQRELKYEKTHAQHFEKLKLLLKQPPDDGKLLDPNSVLEFRQSHFKREIQRFLDKTNYDIVQVEYPNLAHFLPFGYAKTIITQIDVLFRTQMRKSETCKNPIERAAAFYEGVRLFRYERKYARRADLVLTMSHRERDFLESHFKCNLAVCPNGVDTSRIHYHTPAISKRLVFVGNFRHSPNRDAVLYFVKDIYPLLRKMNPSYRLTIAGPNPSVDIEQLAGDPSIDVPGFVPNILDLYRNCGCVVAPITWGSGTRIKILEAMASGIPVVSTSIGAEGLEVTNREHLLIADSSADFATCVESVVNDHDFASRLSAQARVLVEKKYDWDIIADQLDSLFKKLMELK